ncbi:DUF6998 domain-containing protein [Leisingera sp. ANG-M6]|uniref:DUF6998 domain-containing protein n=1 Tax=Leisingera sp. ANG-M6 TaxID=1577900 RepID=UPI00068C3C15|nr:hypothetical protein [Leisingera sp. ANG-M6]
MQTFELPGVISDLVEAQQRVAAFYNARICGADKKVELNFTFDGKLVGDIGEAIAVELFGICLVDKPANAGVDGYANNKSVQVKASGTKRGPTFRALDESIRADHLIFLSLNFEEKTVTVDYNGPERDVLRGVKLTTQRTLSLTAVQQRNAEVREEDRLPLTCKGRSLLKQNGLD